MDEMKMFSQIYEKEYENERLYKKLSQKYKEKTDYRKWVAKTIFTRFFLVPLFIPLALLVSNVFGVVYLILTFCYELVHIFTWIDYVINTPCGYNSGLKERYRCMMEQKKVDDETKKMKVRHETEKQAEKRLFKQLKKDKTKRQDFLEFYHRLQTDNDFRDGYLNAARND